MKLAVVLISLAALWPGAARADWLASKQRAAALARKGDYAGATVAAQKAVQLARKDSGSNRHLGESLEILATLYFAQGRFTEALEPARQAFGIYQKIAGADSPELVNPTKILGAVYMMRGDLDQAEPLLKKAVDLSTRYFGPKSSETAKQLGNLGGLYAARRQPAEARRYLKQALTIWGDHPDPVYGAMTLVNLAEVDADTGERKEADRLFRQAIAIRTKAFGRDHPQTKNIAQSYAAFLKSPSTKQ